ELRELSDAELAELEGVSRCWRDGQVERGFAMSLDELRQGGPRRTPRRGWRDGQVERGFAMSLDELRQDDHGDSLVVLGRDGDGRIRGFLHFAPAYGRAAVSLSAMRRDREPPHGLNEFLVARSLEQLRSRGMREASLNFAAFARFVHAPRNAVERLVGRVLL